MAFATLTRQPSAVSAAEREARVALPRVRVYRCVNAELAMKFTGSWLHRSAEFEAANALSYHALEEAFAWRMWDTVTLFHRSKGAVSLVEVVPLDVRPARDPLGDDPTMNDSTSEDESSDRSSDGRSTSDGRTRGRERGSRCAARDTHTALLYGPSPVPPVHHVTSRMCGFPWAHTGAPFCTCAHRRAGVRRHDDKEGSSGSCRSPASSPRAARRGRPKWVPPPLAAPARHSVHSPRPAPAARPKQVSYRFDEAAAAAGARPPTPSAAAGGRAALLPVRIGARSLRQLPHVSALIFCDELSRFVNPVAYSFPFFAEVCVRGK